MASHTATTILTLAVIPCPIVSLQAEVVISRYKLVSYSLSIISAIITVCGESLPMSNSTLYMILLFLVVLPQSLFIGGYFATAVPLAIDQINGGSNGNISSIIHWLFWANFGFRVNCRAR